MAYGKNSMSDFLGRCWLGFWTALVWLTWGDLSLTIICAFFGLAPLLICWWGAEIWRLSARRQLIGKWEVTSDEEAWILHGLDVEAELTRTIEEEIIKDYQESGGKASFQMHGCERQEGAS